MMMDVQERRKKRRPNLTEVKVDGQSQCGLEGEGTQSRAVWRQLVRNIDPTQKS